MFLFDRHLAATYLVIALLFLGGFVLRLLNLYPGRPEPLILDLSGIFIALVFACAANILDLSSLRFLLILISSLIILPHIIYIVKRTDIAR